ncbi:MAG TPA: acyl-protein synthetase [Psychromonas hadalis]|nr:acyl-protein synthetase [Psychromonas hadalis]
MSVEDKLRTLEQLWDNLCSKEELSLPSPKWHEDVLAERRERIITGQATFTDWEEAKINIRKKVL